MDSDSWISLQVPEGVTSFSKGAQSPSVRVNTNPELWVRRRIARNLTQFWPIGPRWRRML